MPFLIQFNPAGAIGHAAADLGAQQGRNAATTRALDAAQVGFQTEHRAGVQGRAQGRAQENREELIAQKQAQDQERWGLLGDAYDQFVGEEATPEQQALGSMIRQGQPITQDLLKTAAIVGDDEQIGRLNDLISGGRGARAGYRNAGMTAAQAERSMIADRTVRELPATFIADRMTPFFNPQFEPPVDEFGVPGDDPRNNDTLFRRATEIREAFDRLAQEPWQPGTRGYSNAVGRVEELLEAQTPPAAYMPLVRRVHDEELQAAAATHSLQQSLMPKLAALESAGQIDDQARREMLRPHLEGAAAEQGMSPEEFTVSAAFGMRAVGLARQLGRRPSIEEWLPMRFSHVGPQSDKNIYRMHGRTPPGAAP